MAANQGSTLYEGSVAKSAIYEIDKGAGFSWNDHLKTETNVDGKPKQLTRAEHAGNPIQENIENPRDTDFGSTATVTIDGRQLSVTELMVIDKINVREWKDTFPEFQPTGLNVDLKANPKIAKVIFDRIMEATKTQVNELHSAGDDTLASPSSLRFYDGFETLIQADADATEVGANTALTQSNILARVYELRNAVPARLRNKKNLKIFCSYADYDLYDMARRASQTQLAETDITGSGVVNQSSHAARINLVPVEGLSKDFMFATLADKSAQGNLVQGFWAENDLETMKIYRTTEADQEWKIIMRFDTGVQYYTGKDIFYVDNAT